MEKCSNHLSPLALAVPLVSATAVFTLSPVLAQPQTQPTGVFDRVGIAIAAGLAVGLASLGAGLAA